MALTAIACAIERGNCMPERARKRLEGHYDVQGVPFVTVYRRPSNYNTLECGADHEASAPEDWLRVATADPAFWLKGIDRK